MKHQMSAQQSDSLSYAVFGVITGFMEYFRSVKFATVDISLLSIEWITTGFHAGIVGAFCGGMGWIGKKVAEVGYAYFIEFIKNRKSKK